MNKTYTTYTNVKEYTTVTNDNLTRKITQTTKAQKLANSQGASGTFETQETNKLSTKRKLTENELNSIFGDLITKKPRLTIGSEPADFMLIDN
jgi:hypothetical protein